MPKPNTVTISGISYRHIKSGSAGMCHQLDADSYATFHNGRCYLFDAGTHTLCPGVVDGTRELTPTESKALARHLDSIMQSVTINPAN
jgi:hypothetical protein